MNNFNKVFVTVKDICAGKQDATSFDAVSKQVNMRQERLEFYINCLSEVGLIEYSRTKKEIRLTPTGRIRENVFVN